MPIFQISENIIQDRIGKERADSMFDLWRSRKSPNAEPPVRPGLGPEQRLTLEPFMRNVQQNGLRTPKFITRVASGDDDEHEQEDHDEEVKESDGPEFPYCYSKSCHAIVLPLTFICKERRWSRLELSGTHNPIELKISAEDFIRVWGHLLQTRERSYHLVPQCVRTVSYTTLGCPIELAYKLVTAIPNTNKRASWTHATTVASGVHWVIPDGHLSAEQSCAQVNHVTWEADPQLLEDETFMRMKCISDDDLNVNSFLRDNDSRVHLPGINSMLTRQDAVAWLLAQQQPTWIAELPADESVDAEDENTVDLPADSVREFIDSLRNKINPEKNLMSLDQGITMELYPVHPDGWQAWTERRDLAKNTNTLLDPRVKDPFLSLSVMVELVAIPIIAHPNREGVQTVAPHTLGQVPRTNSMWKSSV